MDHPLVSVVMPSHNYGHFIAEAIESFLNQTFRDFELIIVDDASTDNTETIVSTFCDDRLIYFKRQTCSGSGVQPRNDGMALAKGRYIAVADADDVSVWNRLEQQVQFLETHEPVDILGGGLLPINAAGRAIGAPIYKPVYAEDPDRYRYAMLKGKSVLAHGTAVFRKRILDRGDLRGYGPYRSSGDTEFLLRASRYARFCNLQTILIHCRQHRHSVTRRCGARLKKYHHQVFVLQELLWIQRSLGQSESPELKKQVQSLRQRLGLIDATTSIRV